MVWLVLGMTIAVVLAAFVVGIVAVPARRSGRPVLTSRGEQAFRVADERARAARQLALRRSQATGEAAATSDSKSAKEQPSQPASDSAAPDKQTKGVKVGKALRRKSR